ncbi:CPBP family intramembrane glutamic endopeptidase [Flavilitoribacter nigricans]|uniref:CAAX prenyl protease 2/Lysostaphin resistance protein A-like domain-containing protein n=1 Tax=Flavilitoribacter nigricans (strain ATCC 23147 / DSM 23189 / NBRC 102662 / NCIMB 1420 / SS-2) TaxID=1122177 RepID=A0A2D0N0Q0_FLAN2|nr:type II CAAX endopeptidase family protein [Flavilitoribacter nigricans]PHN02101.1 hypothetical protein CRP01_33470 [Flavilitoribacter nigricans DSM 23189 = NBRC 102662]
MSKFLIKRHAVKFYFILTFLISWGAILFLFGTDGIPATAELQEQIGMTILLGPALASMILIAIYKGKRGLRELGAKLVKWRINIRWYSIALLTAPLATVLSLAGLALFTKDYQPAITNSNDIYSLLFLGIVGGLIIGLFEELGWTGFAVPRLLQKFNSFTSGAIIGIVWGAWHFILFWEHDSFTGTVPFLLLLARLFSWLPAYRILMVWVYERTESLLVIICMHASLVASLAILDPIIYGKDLLIYILIRATILLILVGLLTVYTRRAERLAVSN